MTVLEAFGDPPPGRAIQEALRALSSGRVVGLPTDTVYGLAADVFNTAGTDRLFALKRRPRTMDLPVLVADLDQALGLTAGITPEAELLARLFWPGPLTLVVPRLAGLHADLGEDEATIGVRCPADPVPLTLCRTGSPLATTSANLHGEPTASTAGQVAQAFGDGVAVVLDAGSRLGRASTVVDCTGRDPRCLREGRIPWKSIIEALGKRGTG